MLVVGLLAPAAPHFFARIGLPRFIASILLLSAPYTPPVLHGVFPGLVNGSLWTIFYEFRCYLLVGLLGAVGLVRRRAFWLLATVIFFILAYDGAAQQLHFTWHRYKFLTGEPSGIYRLTAAFLCGGCFYLYRKPIIFRPLYAVSAACFVLVVFRLWSPASEPFLVVAGGYLLFYFAHAPLQIFAFMSHVPDISYGIYLYGWPVEALWTYYRHGSPWITFAASTLLCAVLVWLSWHLVERPMLSLKRRATAPLPPP